MSVTRRLIYCSNFRTKWYTGNCISSHNHSYKEHGDLIYQMWNDLAESLYAPDSSFDSSAMTHISPKQISNIATVIWWYCTFISHHLHSNNIPGEFVSATSTEDRNYHIKSGSLDQVIKDFRLYRLVHLLFVSAKTQSFYRHASKQWRIILSIISCFNATYF